GQAQGAGTRPAPTRKPMTVFLKLGGSLITDKNTPRTPRPETLARLMREVAEARAARPRMRLVLGHGSGSFGHVEGKKYGTRAGARTEAEWRGFAEVQAAAGLLNRLVVDAAREAGLPVVNFPPSASAICREGVIQSMAFAPIQTVLDHDLIPLVFGDVAIDQVRGGTILSTEDVFRYLAPQLKPERVLLAGIEAGVLARWPDGEVIPEITAVGATHESPLQNLGGSHAADVTGGMASKVREMLALAASVPGVTIQIFSGEMTGLVRAALVGEGVRGTRISTRPDTLG
ncbi:MAG: isopentenyl phosphate kinase, partial [Anaerolineales bacterium]